jgi:hypothetical protein
LNRRATSTELIEAPAGSRPSMIAEPKSCAIVNTSESSRSERPRTRASGP